MSQASSRGRNLMGKVGKLCQKKCKYKQVNEVGVYVLCVRSYEHTKMGPVWCQGFRRIRFSGKRTGMGNLTDSYHFSSLKTVQFQTVVSYSKTAICLNLLNFFEFCLFFFKLPKSPIICICVLYLDALNTIGGGYFLPIKPIRFGLFFYSKTAMVNNKHTHLPISEMEFRLLLFRGFLLVRKDADKSLGLTH